jgi:predicted O-methyltransferase YrrM
MNSTLDKIFETRQFVQSDGKIINIHSETGREQCLFLQEIIKKNSFKKSIEIGFAYGISTLAITEAISENGGTHVVLDKFQNSDWGGWV